MSGLALASVDEARLLSGTHDQVLRRVRDRFGVDIVIRDLEVQVRGGSPDAIQAAVEMLAQLLERVRHQGALPLDEVDALLRRDGADAAPPQPGGDGSRQTTNLEGFQLRTAGQRRYVSAMERDDVVFSIGPAGTGKTFLAVLMAVQALKRGTAQKLILCRPAVEAGESLGYLPGDFQAKVNPYMRPLYDALYTVLGFETVKKYMEREVVEVAPLAYMRGRTLQDAFIILDEAQNTTRAQMKMFLTRMGERSRVVVTGDVTQIDLPHGTTSGLVHAQAILRGVPGISMIELTTKDIVRHELVWRIIEAYDASPAQTPAQKRRKRR